MKAILVAGAVVAVGVGIMVSGGSGKGIIALDNWEHGVVVCGEAVVINHGHEKDPRVQELLALADRECPK